MTPKKLDDEIIKGGVVETAPHDVKKIDEEEMKVKWSLEPEYEKQVRELYEAFKQAAGLDDEESSDDNVIQGPWKK